MKLQWQSRSYSSSTRAMNIESSAGSWYPRGRRQGSAETQCLNRTFASGASECNISRIHAVRRAHRMLGSWSRRSARAELRTEQILYLCELPDLPSSSCHAHLPTTMMRTTAMMDPVLIKPINLTKCTCAHKFAAKSLTHCSHITHRTARSSHTC